MQGRQVEQAQDQGPPPDYVGPVQHYENPRPEFIAKLNELSQDEAVDDEEVKEKLRRAIEMAPTISIMDSVPRAARERAVEFRELIDDIDTFLDDSLERSDDVLLFRTEAVLLQRALSSNARPGSQARGELARFLRNLTLALHKSDRNTEACALDAEALAIRRECYRARPGVERPLLAQMLHTYSQHLHTEEQYEDALKLSEEEVKLRRLLSEFDPEEGMKGLANALQDLGTRFSSVQRFEDAKNSEEEALVLWRILYSEDPEANHSSLVQCLTNYIVSLTDLGLPKETRAARAERDKLSKPAE